MVAQPTGVFLVGGSDPGRMNTAPCRHRRQQYADQDSNRQPKTARRLHYHSTGSGLIETGFPTAWSLLSENFLTPPTPTPPSKE